MNSKVHASHVSKGTEMFENGVIISHPKLGELVVLEFRLSLSRFVKRGEGEENAFWMPTEKMKKELEKGPRVEQVELSDGLIGYIEQLRLVYPPSAQYYLDKIQRENGFALDDKTRPVEVGKRGGTTVQRTVAAEIEFREDTPENLWPDGAKRNMKTGRIEVNSLSVAIALLKAGAVQTHFV